MPFWIWDSSGQVNLWLQSVLGDPRWLLPVTFAGDELFYLILIPFVFYTIDRRAGVTLLVAQLFTHSINVLLKLAFHEPRPFWVTLMNVFAFEDTFGLPSGHAQNAVVVWGYLAFFFIKQKRLHTFPVIALTALWVFLIGISRIALGVHFIQDTLLGWAIGCALLYIVIRYETSVRSFLANRTHAGRLFVTVVLAVLLLEVGALLATTLHLPLLSEWNETARLSIASTPHSGVRFKDLHPLKLTSFLNVAGCLFGLYASLSLKDPGYTMPVLFRNRLFVLLPGLALIFVVYLSLSAIFPRDGIEGGFLRILRYGLVVFTGLYVYPLILERVRRRA